MATYFFLYDAIDSCMYVLQCHYKDIVIVLPCSFYDNIIIYKFIINYMRSDQNN